MLIIALLLALFETPAQSHKTDSLKELLSTQSEAKDLLHTYWQLSYEYAVVDNKLALFYGKKSLNIATDLADSAMIVKAARMTAYVYRQMEFIDSSNTLSLKVLPLAQRCGSIEEHANLVRGMAVNYLWMGDFVQALDYNLEAYRVSLKTCNPNYLKPVLNNMGLIYYKIGNYKKALDYYASALKMRGNKLCEDHTPYLNQSLCYSNSNKYDSARQAIAEALRVCPSLEKDKNLEYLFAMARLYDAQDDFNQAIHYYLTTWNEAIRTNIIRYQLDCAVSLIDISIKQNQKNKSLEYLKQIEHLIGRTPYRYHMMGVYMKLADMYKKNNDMPRFILFQSRYIELKDSLYDKKYINDMVRVERQHVEEQKNEQLALQQDKLNVSEKAREKQRYLSWFVGIIAVFLVSFLIVVYRNYRQGKKMNDLLNEKVKERTKELENVNVSLNRLLDAELAFRHKKTAEIKQASTKIKALIGIALKGSDQERCLQEIEAVAKELESGK